VLTLDYRENSLDHPAGVDESSRRLFSAERLHKTCGRRRSNIKRLMNLGSKNVIFYIIEIEMLRILDWSFDYDNLVGV